MENAKIMEKRVQNTHERLFLESLHSVLDKRSTNEHKLFPSIYMPLVQSCNDNDTIILDEIVRRVKEAKLYSIIAHETPGNSKTEQLSLLVRYVWNGKVEERLLGVIPVKETTAEVLFNTVCNKVEEHGVEISNLRGQCYGGASNVAGVHTGLQARIKEISPSVLFTTAMPMC
jgi:hypothetical protein